MSNFLSNAFKEKMMIDEKTNFFINEKDKKELDQWAINFKKLPDSVQKYFIEKAMKEIKEEEEEKEKKELKAIQTESLKPALSSKAQSVRDRLREKLLKKHNLS